MYNLGIVFLYRILDKNNKLTFTCDCDYADDRSKRGDWVYGRTISDGHRIRR